jgi:uncharacterized protein YciI
VRYVVFYESNPDAAAKIPEVFPAHREHWTGFVERRELVAIGPFSDRSGAMAVFTTREAAEAFAEGDPFVLEGVISRWYVREWMEALSESED